MFHFKDFGIDSDIVILTLAVITIFLVIMLIVLLVKISRLNTRYMYFMRDKEGKSLEEVFHNKFQNMDYINDELKRISGHLNEIDLNLMRTYQKIGIVKYDAFKEIGGTLSFVLALLTKDDDGFILNSMHSNSEGCYTYIKEIKKGEVFVELSEEERKALESAKGNRAL